MANPSFAVLWKMYSSQRIGGNCASYKHQCAMRMSAALAGAGFRLRKYKENTCKANGVVHARGAEALANYLGWRLFKPKKSYFFSARSDVKGKTGIIFFKDIKGFRSGRGDHIDLWNGSRTKTGEYFKRCSEVWFWPLK